MRTRFLLLCLVAMFSYNVVLAQDDDEEIFYVVDIMPEFPGGEPALRDFIASNTQYPAAAQAEGIKGKVYVRFVVSPKGEVENIEVARGVHPLLDAEALRVIKSLPKWTAGENDGKKVSVWYTIPIKFGI